jgi:hypothetical protein
MFAIISIHCSFLLAIWQCSFHKLSISFNHGNSSTVSLYYFCSYCFAAITPQSKNLLDLITLAQILVVLSFKILLTA